MGQEEQTGGLSISVQRSPADALVERVTESVLPTRHGIFRIVGYRSAGDGAELAGPAVVAENLEGQLGLVDRSGVVAEATDDGRVDDRGGAARVEALGDGLELLHPALAGLGGADEGAEVGAGRGAGLGAGGDEAEDEWGDW